MLAIDREKGKLVVEGVNRFTSTSAAARRTRKGGRLSKEMPVQIATCCLFCSRCNKGVRTGARVRERRQQRAVLQEVRRRRSGEISPAKKK